MPPEALAWLTARSVLTRSSAPSMADDVPLSSMTPIRIGEPVAGWPPVVVAAPPPHATASRVPAAAIARRLQDPPVLSPMTDLPPCGSSGGTPPDGHARRG